MRIEFSANQEAIARELLVFGEKLGVRDGTLFKLIGRSIQQTLKVHFNRLANDSAHHQTADSLGANRTGLYTEAARGTQNPELRSDGVAISINQRALAQRFFGGTIKPTTGKFLTIPARTEAYGHRAREFDNLVPIIFRGGQSGALVERDATVVRGGARGAGAGRSKGQGIGGGVFFWLVKRVVQRADPSVLPSAEEMIRPALSAASDYIERLWERQAA